MAYETVLFVTCIAALPIVSGCDSRSRPAPPARAAASAAPVSSAVSAEAATDRLPAWEPVDAKFAGCEQTCGAGPGVSHAGAHVQPGAEVGDLAYCPVSGAVFRVSGASSRRYVNGKALYFCCESCASYFSAHVDEVLAQRGLPPSGG
jgi:YHS domain-containing protein